MDDSYIPLIEDAVSNHRKKDAFETNLSRAVHKNGMKYEVYIEIVTELREFAYSHDMDLLTAVKRVLEIAKEQAKGKESGIAEGSEPYRKV